jgi:diguanylate cyclase (GGDEF)-like protein/PAS domain S-box-containing protein
MSLGNEDLLRLLVAETRDYAIFMLDVEGNVATWNAGALRFKGYEADEIIGRHFSVFYPPEDIAVGKPQRELEDATATGRLEDEGWRLRKDGSRFWANVVITALRDADGALRGFGKVTRDLTERRRHEMAVREREQLVSGVLSAATECSIIGTDLDGLITVFNSGAERMLGYRADELIGAHTPALLHDADEIVARAEQLGIAPGFEVFTTVASQGGAEKREWTYVRKDGSRLPVELTLTAVLDDDRRPRGFIGIAVDLSEHRRAQAAQRAADEEAEIMETAFSRAPGGVALIALDGRFLRVNAALCDILGRSEAEIVGGTSAGFTHPDDLAVTADAFAALVATGAQVRTEKRYLRPDGRVVWASTVGTALKAHDGRLTHIVSHFRDVTDQRLAERELRASEENLRNVATLARGLPSHENPRQAICEAARTIAGADIVQLWEPDAATHLRVTAATGTELSPDLRVPLAGEVSGTVSAYHSGQRCIVLDTHAPGAPVSIRMRKRLGAASALYEPVLGRDGAVGVLVVIWTTAITQTRDREVNAVGLLAAEAATAIERADLTAQLHAVARKDELRVRQLLEATPDAMIIFDAVGIIQTVNDQTQRLFGYTHDELVGESIDALVPDWERTDDPGLAAPVTTTASTRAINAERELHARHRDGHGIPVSITLSPVQTDEGPWAIAAVRDITERRLAEEQLKAAEDHFRRSFDDAPIGMSIADLNGRYLQVNDAFCTLLGHSRTTLLGLSRQAITHPDDLAADQETAQRLLAGEARSVRREKRFLHATGSVVWTSLNVTLVRDAEGRPDHFIAQVQDITERRLYEHQLKHMADHDPLTGLLNRRSFQRELDSHVARVKRFGAVGAVMMVDLDNFKYYNDTQGHSAGDDLIVRIAQTLQTRLRETDMIARLGGDEFAVLLPHEDRDSAQIVATGLLELIRGQASAPTMGEQRRVTASIGIACFADGDQLMPDEIMVNADLAMYDAKQNGRNQSAQYRSDEHERPRIENQMKWASEITQALAEDRFELLAQPIVALHGTSAPSSSCCCECATPTATGSRRAPSSTSPSGWDSSRRSTAGSSGTRSTCSPSTAPPAAICALRSTSPDTRSAIPCCSN